MSDYRAFLIGLDGHIFSAVVLDEPDDAAAIALVGGHDVELWQGTRKIAKFECEQNMP
jgi:hypothetical protein